ncbi:NifU family protein [Catenulispora subtropica]|uniref:Nitrogen-fixing NifU domain protein n=1 Tax=Catenulispora subtropica TaxID=450798 RepID=A0ABP5DYI0_9ACTN
MDGTDEMDRLVEVGERIERVLEGGDPSRPVARDEARDLVRLVTDLYGAGLQRLLALVDEAGALHDALLSRIADDPLVGSLLLVHGLHPDSVERRVAVALEELRPQLERHDVTVEAEVRDDAAVRLRVVGASGCASTSEALVDGVRAAVEAAAPEAVVEVETARADSGTFIPLESLMPGLRPGSAPEAPGRSAADASCCTGPKTPTRNAVPA